MTNKTNGDADSSYRSNSSNGEGLLFKHGGYRNLQSYQMATLVYDLTVKFCELFIDRKSRTNDQMVQAARSGRQNIAEGSQASGTSKKTEIKLTSVARASLEELLIDYEDFLRQRGFQMWTKESQEAKTIRNLAYSQDRSYATYSSYLNNPKSAANMLICIIHQTNYLLDQQLKKLSEEFSNQGGFTERLYDKRQDYRKN
ncbi:MAG: four helix bundle suffix domain-containing protein [Candidatus Moranbacteria bacterium]|nr:four helix bundle suffix domain-containing protein [Candidatus Moranbacteria bacterium]